MKSLVLFSSLWLFSLNVNATSICGAYLQAGLTAELGDDRMDDSNSEPDYTRNKVRSFEDLKHMMARANDESRNRDFAAAVASLSAILEYKPEDIIALNLLATTQMNLGLVSEARLNKEKVVGIEGRYNEGTYVTYSQLLILDGAAEKSIPYLTAVLEDRPQHTVALGLIAKAYLAIGKFVLAKTYLDEKSLLDINDPNYQILLFEYYYKQGSDRAEFYKKALGVAKSMEHAHRPKKDQVRIPRSYRKSLALKAKAQAALNGGIGASKSDLQHALKDIREYESYNQFPSSWSILLQAEILFKLGKMEESQQLLFKLLGELNQRDLLVLATLVHIETQGKNTKISNDQINAYLDALTPLELVEVLRLSQNLDWDYTAPVIEDAWYNTSIVNHFWYHNDSVILPVSNFVSKATSTPKRVVRRRGFSS